MLRSRAWDPKKVKALHDKLGIETVAELEAACEAGRVAGRSGFRGEDTGEYPRRDSTPPRIRLAAFAERGAARAEALSGDPRSHPDVIRCGSAGSLRRRREVIGDIDLLASSKSRATVLEFFTHQPADLKRDRPRGDQGQRAAGGRHSMRPPGGGRRGISPGPDVFYRKQGT